jgi:vacuolar-type H+-ATPase subunit I/STV1
MNAIGCKQVEPDFAVTIPHPPRKSRNLNEYKGTTLGELIDLLEHSWEQRDRMGKQRNEAEKKSEAQAKRIRELEAQPSPDALIQRHQKEIAEQLWKRTELLKEIYELKEDNASLKAELNGLGDINIAQAAELGKLREQLKGRDDNPTLTYHDFLKLDRFTVKLNAKDGSLEVKKFEGKIAGYEWVLSMPISRWFNLGRAATE